MKNKLFAILIGLFIFMGCNPEDNPVTPVTPENPEVNFSLNTKLITDNIVYPFPSKDAVQYSFEVVSEQKLDSVKVELIPDNCISASYTMNPDGISGTVSITAKKDYEFNAANVKLVVSCEGKKQNESLPVSLAYLKLSETSGAISSEGGELHIKVDTNVEIEAVQDEDSKKFSSFTKDAGIVNIMVDVNQDFDERGGKIVVTDKKGILSAEYSFTQAGSLGSRFTDSLALVKMYNDMEGWKWAERGAFEILTKNWCTSEPLEHWGGVVTNSHYDLETYENLHDGRVTRFNMSIIYEDGSQHELSEAIGELKALYWIEIDGLGLNGRVPRSLANLPELKKIDISGSNFCDKLIDHPIKNIANQLDFLMLGGDVWGPVPEWVSLIKLTRLDVMNLSGRIPDEVWKQEEMQSFLWAIWSDEISGRIPFVDACILDNAERTGYAMWYGEEQPEDVEFVEDEHEGHWQWKDKVSAWKWIKIQWDKQGFVYENLPEWVK